MALGDSIGLLAAVTALVGAAYRYAAVLVRMPAASIERSTAFGFFTGLALAATLIGLRSVGA